MTKKLTEVDGLYYKDDKMGLWTSIATGMHTKAGLDNFQENSGWDLM